MTVIDYRPEVPPEVKAAIAPHLERWAFLIPPWCQVLNILWNDSDDHGALHTVTSYEYRRADLTICPNFLTGPDKRELDVIHELLHIVTEPMHNVMCDMRDELADKNESVKKWAEEQVRYGTEAVVCDLAAILLAHAK